MISDDDLYTDVSASDAEVDDDASNRAKLGVPGKEPDDDTKYDLDTQGQTLDDRLESLDDETLGNLSRLLDENEDLPISSSRAMTADLQRVDLSASEAVDGLTGDVKCDTAKLHAEVSKFPGVDKAAVRKAIVTFNRKGKALHDKLKVKLGLEDPYLEVSPNIVDNIAVSATWATIKEVRKVPRCYALHDRDSATVQFLDIVVGKDRAIRFDPIASIEIGRGHRPPTPAYKRAFKHLYNEFVQALVAAGLRIFVCVSHYASDDVIQALDLRKPTVLCEAGDKGRYSGFTRIYSRAGHEDQRILIVESPIHPGSMLDPKISLAVKLSWARKFCSVLEPVMQAIGRGGLDIEAALERVRLSGDRLVLSDGRYFHHYIYTVKRQCFRDQYGPCDGERRFQAYLYAIRRQRRRYVLRWRAGGVDHVVHIFIKRQSYQKKDILSMIENQRWPKPKYISVRGTVNKTTRIPTSGVDVKVDTRSRLWSLSWIDERGQKVYALLRFAKGQPVVRFDVDQFLCHGRLSRHVTTPELHLDGQSIDRSALPDLETVEIHVATSSRQWDMSWSSVSGHLAVAGGLVRFSSAVTYYDVRVYVVHGLLPPGITATLEWDFELHDCTELPAWEEINITRATASSLWNVSWAATADHPAVAEGLVRFAKGTGLCLYDVKQFLATGTLPVGASQVHPTLEWDFKSHKCTELPALEEINITRATASSLWNVSWAATADHPAVAEGLVRFAKGAGLCLYDVKQFLATGTLPAGASQVHPTLEWDFKSHKLSEVPVNVAVSPATVSCAWHISALKAGNVVDGLIRCVGPVPRYDVLKFINDSAVPSGLSALPTLDLDGETHSTSALQLLSSIQVSPAAYSKTWLWTWTDKVSGRRISAGLLLNTGATPYDMQYCVKTRRLSAYTDVISVVWGQQQHSFADIPADVDVDCVMARRSDVWEFKSTPALYWKSLRTPEAMFRWEFEEWAKSRVDDSADLECIMIPRCYSMWSVVCCDSGVSSDPRRSTQAASVPKRKRTKTMNSTTGSSSSTSDALMAPGGRGKKARTGRKKTKTKINRSTPEEKQDKVTARSTAGPTSASVTTETQQPWHGKRKKTRITGQQLQRKKTKKEETKKVKTTNKKQNNKKKTVEFSSPYPLTRYEVAVHLVDLQLQRSTHSNRLSRVALIEDIMGKLAPVLQPPENGKVYVVTWADETTELVHVKFSSPTTDPTQDIHQAMAELRRGREIVSVDAGYRHDKYVIGVKTQEDQVYEHEGEWFVLSCDGLYKSEVVAAIWRGDVDGLPPPGAIIDFQVFNAGRSNHEQRLGKRGVQFQHVKLSCQPLDILSLQL